jgi:hypothetical protein
MIRVEGRDYKERLNGARAQRHNGTTVRLQLEKILIKELYLHFSANVFIINLNRCKMGNFQKLRVWQLAKEIAVKIYRLTQKQEFSKDFGFKDQIQRSAVSIPSNISEGDELETDK